MRQNPDTRFYTSITCFAVRSDTGVIQTKFVYESRQAKQAPDHPSLGLIGL